MRHWAILCRVVDHYGDAAVCWRLARQLAAEKNARVSLWIDHPEVLACLEPALSECPGRSRGVDVRPWDHPNGEDTRSAAAADVVVSAFGCALPETLRAAMRATTRPPVWINLEYFSAESWVDSHHGLASPKADGLVEYFFFPGLSAASGGVLHETGLEALRDAWQANPGLQAGFLAQLGCIPRPGERLLSVFAYPEAPVTELICALHSRPGLWRVLLAGAPDVQRRRAWARPLGTDRIRIQALPFVSQDAYDRLLWCCDVNLVRGEDSLVRALWAGRPFLWHAYRQPQHAHLAKVAALQARLSLPGSAWQAAMRIWNGHEPIRAQGRVEPPNPAAVRTLARWLDEAHRQRPITRQWARDLAGPGADLATRLDEFVTRHLPDRQGPGL